MEAREALWAALEKGRQEAEEAKELGERSVIAESAVCCAAKKKTMQSVSEGSDLHKRVCCISLL